MPVLPFRIDITVCIIRYNSIKWLKMHCRKVEKYNYFEYFICDILKSIVYIMICMSSHTYTHTYIYNIMILWIILYTE